MKETIDELIERAKKENVHEDMGDEKVPLIKVASALHADAPYILSAPSPDEDDRTLVIANGNEDELFNCAQAIIAWIAGMRGEKNSDDEG